MSAGLVPETILIMLLALIGDREWKKSWEMFVFGFTKKNPQIPDSQRVQGPF